MINEWCSLSEGGAPPRFLIIDDGWQQIGSEVKDQKDVVVQEGAQYVDFKHFFFSLSKW